MLRITAPCVASVGVIIPGLQADQQPVGRAGVNIAFRERGLERHRLFQRVGEGQRAVLLFDRYDAPPRAACSRFWIESPAAAAARRVGWRGGYGMLCRGT